MAKTHYSGKAGQFAAMAELALRGYNVAMPEIDVGDDVYIFNDKTNSLWRLQAKTSREYPQKKATRYQFGVKRTAITTNSPTPLFFVFVMRYKGKWDFIIIQQGTLLGYLNAKQIAKQKGEMLTITLVRYSDGPRKDKVFASKTLDVTTHLNDWSTWPPV